ncbi:MAG: sugar transferase [Clostridiales bacterium]|nr:sugar transferase [Clostridiales bacterium]
MKNFYKRFLKRFFDFFLALILLAILSPLLFIVAFAIKITDFKEPVIFKQQRVGRYQKLFVIYKFRTFKKPTPFDINNPVIKKNNSNVTFVGKIIRQFKIDELPQLFNILKGDMGFVGPRPFVQTYLRHYQDWELSKFCMRPGLTGLAQIKGNGHLTRVERSYYDVMYINCGLWTEFVIFFKSVLVIILGEKKFYKPVTQEQLQECKTLAMHNYLIDYYYVYKVRQKAIDEMFLYVRHALKNKTGKL